MIAAYARSDIVHIMKMNRFTLSDSDTVHFELDGQGKGNSYKLKILVVENLPRISVIQNGEAVYSDTMKNIDDLKTFFEERLYKYLEV